jgi:hypothetical protein
MYPSWSSVVILNICRIAFALITLACFIPICELAEWRYFFGLVVSVSIAAWAHEELETRLTFPSTELRNNKDSFLSALAKQLPESSAGQKVYIRIPMKCIRGKSCKPKDVTVAIAHTEHDYDFYSSTVRRRYRVEENRQSYSLEYCDLDGQFSIPLPFAGAK